MKNLQIDVLRSFTTVAELGSFTRASELLSRSQPAISLQIKRLEKQVNTPLFMRSDHQLKLTEEGETLFDYAWNILKLNDEAFSSLEKPLLSGSIRFGIPSEFATTLLPKIVGRFSQSYPTVTLNVTCDLSVNLLSNKKQFDLILVLQDNLKIKQSDRIRTDELVWVTSENYDTHQRDTIPLIVAPDGCIYRDRAIQKLDRIKQPWRIVYTVPDLASIQSAIEEGLGVTVLAKGTVPDNLNIIKPSRQYPSLGKIGVHLINRTTKTNEAVNRLIDYVRINLG